MGYGPLVSQNAVFEWARTKYGRIQLPRHLITTAWDTHRFVFSSKVSGVIRVLAARGGPWVWRPRSP